MSYLDGGTLKSKMEKGDISLQNALSYTQDILEAISYLESINIVHRDIKPANVMFSLDKNRRTGRMSETLKLIDYGLSADFRDVGDGGLMCDKCGTLGYLAPELLGKRKVGEFYGPKVDVFSAGILLFEMYASILFLYFFSKIAFFSKLK